MAWSNDTIRMSYESNFDEKYLYTYYGITALIFMFKQIFITYSIENCQKLLEDNYESFQPLFETLDRDKLEEKSYEIANYHRERSNKCNKIRPFTSNIEKLNGIEYLKNFPMSKQSQTLQKIKNTFNIKKTNTFELLSLAKKLSVKLNLKLYREAKRRKNVLLKWFHDNWSIIEPALDIVDDAVRTPPQQNSPLLNQVEQEISSSEQTDVAHSYNNDWFFFDNDWFFLGEEEQKIF